MNIKVIMTQLRRTFKKIFPRQTRAYKLMVSLFTLKWAQKIEYVLYFTGEGGEGGRKGGGRSLDFEVSRHMKVLKAMNQKLFVRGQHQYIILKRP